MSPEEIVHNLRALVIEMANKVKVSREWEQAKHDLHVLIKDMENTPEYLEML